MLHNAGPVGELRPYNPTGATRELSNVLGWAVLTLWPQRRHGCLLTGEAMPVETKFLRLRRPVELGHRIDGWCVCWLGGWDRPRIFYVVMVSRV
jgi:hypothetical protein